MLEQFASELMSEILQPVERMKSSGSKLVHYTSSDAALSILSSESMFMRSVTCMNDIAEVRHGIDAIVRELTSERATDHFWGVLDRAHSGLSAEIKAAFDDGRTDAELETYIACLSEHSPSDDRYGRLSMWRGYGSGPNVALVIKPDAALAESDVLGAYTYPVIYKTEAELSEMFQAKFQLMQTAKDILAEVDRVQLRDTVSWILDAFVYCLKHPVFAEEREWRVVYRPNKIQSSVLEQSVQSIGGVPQPVFKIPLKLHGNDGQLDLRPASLIEKVIIGPTDAPYVQYRAFISALERAGVENAEQRVAISRVPFRNRVQ